MKHLARLSVVDSVLSPANTHASILLDSIVVK